MSPLSHNRHRLAFRRVLYHLPVSTRGRLFDVRKLVSQVKYLDTNVPLKAKLCFKPFYTLPLIQKIHSYLLDRI